MPSTNDKSGENVTYYSDNCTVTSVTVAQVWVELLPANPNRQGLSMYNVPANSLYLRYSSSSNPDTRRIANDSVWDMASPFVWRGSIWGRRNSGTGPVNITEYI